MHARASSEDVQVDTVVDDIKSIMEEGMDQLGRFPKIIIYSNFAHAFKRIKSFLDNEDICYAYGFHHHHHHV